MNSSLQTAHSWVTSNTVLCFRFIVFIVFVGHGFVSLGYSPSYELHHRIFEAVNIFGWNLERVLKIQGSIDILLGILVMAAFFPRYFLYVPLVYLCSVAVAAWIYFNVTTGHIFGIAESFRRFAWIFYVIFLVLFYTRHEKRFALLRIGIGFAFLAHGLASLGFFGLKGGHIELASQVLSEEAANKVVYYSGFSDTTLGTLMVLGILSRPAAIIGSIWLVFVVYLSALLAFPDAIFRTGFLLSCIYVAMDKRCHSFIWKRGVIETGERPFTQIS